MATPMIDFCEQTNPKMLTEVRRIKRFENATRIHNGSDQPIRKNAPWSGWRNARRDGSVPTTSPYWGSSPR